MLLHGQPSPTILYTDSLSHLADMARLYAVLCWTFSFVPPNGLKVRLSICPCARGTILS